MKRLHLQLDALKSQADIIITCEFKCNISYLIGCSVLTGVGGVVFSQCLRVCCCQN